MSENANNKRIAKNTLFLYIRMMALMVITLYTQRVVLDKLGIEDFGIYNIVAGLTSMFTFFSTSLANATQRYLNIELGRNNKAGASKVFSQHIFIYMGFTLIVFIAAETFGLWFVKHKLVIPPDRLTSALWTFHFMVLSVCVTLLCIVFNSAIIAHEDMKVYSYIGIVEGVAKLAIAFIISTVSFDRLIAYSTLLAFVVVAIQIYYGFYCLKHYDECKIRLRADIKSIKQTLGFISWNMLGTVIYMLKDQGLNILLNLFFGPAINAARAISFQVSSAITSFSNNFFMSVRPQMVKSYATGNTNYFIKLFFYSTKYSLFLIWLFCLPAMLCIDDLLALWLKEVPEHTNIFTVWVLADVTLATMTNAPWTAILSVGKMKRYVLFGNGTLLLIFPISYLFLALGHDALSVFIVTFIIRIVQVVAVITISNQYVKFGILAYLRKVIQPAMLVFFFSGIISYIFHLSTGITHATIVNTTVVSSTSITAAIIVCGLSSGERKKIKQVIMQKLCLKKLQRKQEHS